MFDILHATRSSGVHSAVVKHPCVPVDDLRRMLSELAIEQEDEATLMEMAGKTGDGVISFDEFKTLMHATSRPNPITRVSMMAPGMAPGASIPSVIQRSVQDICGCYARQEG